MQKNAITHIAAALVCALGSGCGNRGGGSNNSGITEGEDAGDTNDTANDDDEGETEGEGDDEGDEGDEGDPADICAELTFDNPLDEAMCPHVQGLSVDPEPADAIEICRRLYVDLLGVSPTAVNYEVDCKDRTPTEIVDDFMARPEYVLMSQRMWADVFHMNSELTFYRYVQDLDALVGSLYTADDASRLALNAFAVLAVTHPGFLGRWDGQDLISFNFKSHLGRDANPPERQDIFPLFRMWAEREFTDPLQGMTKRVVLDTNQCVNAGLCSSDFWEAGDQVVIPTPMPGSEDPEANVIDVDALTDADWATLRLPGQRIAESGEFYEGFVDRTLLRYLGYKLGVAVPEARQVLVDLLVESGGNVRAVDRTILTSILYTSAGTWEEDAKADEQDWDPPYWHGPIKQMDAEVWLRSAQRLVGLPEGSCDHRFPVVVGTHPHSYPVMEGGTTPDYSFRDTARLLGGCPDRVESFRETRAGLIAALTQATLTKDLCEAATLDAPIYPAQFVEDPNNKSVEALGKAGDQIYASALIRPLPDSAAEALADGVEGCRDETDCLPGDFAFHTCRLILKSADFLFY
jgi:hypothetical protein